MSILTLVGAACGDDDDDTPALSTSTAGGVAEPGGPVAWPAPPSPDVERLATSAGLALETKESLEHHVHAHLDVFIDGEHRTVPAGIGIVIDNPGVQAFDEGGERGYGGIDGCAQPCISPLHTHDVTGTIHTESATAVDNTLGQLFKEWGVRLDDKCVGDYCTPATPIALYLNGTEQPLEAAAVIALTEGLVIAIVIGEPPERIPNAADFSEA